MNCDDVSRILDSTDVNALAAAERRAAEAHAESCPRCGPEWIVYTRLAAIPMPAMPQQLALRCEALVARSPGRTVLLGTILVVAAAAAMLMVQLMSASPTATVLRGPGSAANQAAAIPASATAEVAATGQHATLQPVTVQLVLDQSANDAIGRDYGQQVYQRAREELRALAGVVLVDAGTPGTFRITYTNYAKSSGSGQDLDIAVELLFKVEAFKPGADGAGTWQPVFWSTPPPPGVVDIPPSVMEQYRAPSFDREQAWIAASARGNFRPSARPVVPADCVERVAGRCPYTPADIAAFTILSWYLERAAPDSMLVARLHAMLRDSSTPPGLWFMALVNLLKHQKLHLNPPELLAAWERIDGDDPPLSDALLQHMLGAASGPDLVRELRNRLLKGSREEREREGSVLRTRLVTLLATGLKSESATRDLLESVAASDPAFEVRAAAKQALGAEPESHPQPRPTTSFMGPIEQP